jgi:hypothetical protein
MNKIYRSADEIDFKTEDADSMPVPNRVLMVRPDYFDVSYVINPHMKNKIGSVDKIEAIVQWQQLVDGFRKIGSR